MGQVLRFYFYAVDKAATRKDAFNETVRNVMTFWNMARIKTMYEHNCVKKLEKLWEEWRGLQKSKKAAAKKVEDFKKRMDQLWDIGAPDAVEVIRSSRLLPAASKEEDIAFYADQKGPRKGSMSGNDKIFAAKKRLQKDRREKEQQARCRRDDDAGMRSESRSMSVDTDSEEDDAVAEPGDDGDAEVQLPRGRTPRLKEEITITISRHILNAPAVKEVADRFLMSNNQVCPTITVHFTNTPVPLCLYLPETVSVPVPSCTALVGTQMCARPMSMFFINVSSVQCPPKNNKSIESHPVQCADYISVIPQPYLAPVYVWNRNKTLPFQPKATPGRVSSLLSSWQPFSGLPTLLLTCPSSPSPNRRQGERGRPTGMKYLQQSGTRSSHLLME